MGVKDYSLVMKLITRYYYIKNAGKADGEASPGGSISKKRRSNIVQIEDDDVVVL